MIRYPSSLTKNLEGYVTINMAVCFYNSELMENTIHLLKHYFFQNMHVRNHIPHVIFHIPTIPYEL